MMRFVSLNKQNGFLWKYFARYDITVDRMLRRPIPKARPFRGSERIILSPSVSFSLTMIFAVFSIVLLYNMAKSIATAYQRSQLLAQAEQEVDELRMRNLKLREKLDRVSGDEYVEQEARDRLQYSKDGEIMVLLPESLNDLSERSGVLGAASDADEEDEGKVKSEIHDETGGIDNKALKEEGWKRWLALLVEGV